MLHANKLHGSAFIVEQASNGEEKDVASTLDSNLIGLDPRFSMSERKELKK
jgi:hypothetical protein